MQYNTSPDWLKWRNWWSVRARSNMRIEIDRLLQFLHTYTHTRTAASFVKIPSESLACLWSLIDALPVRLLFFSFTLFLTLISGEEILPPCLSDGINRLLLHHAADRLIYPHTHRRHRHQGLSIERRGQKPGMRERSMTVESAIRAWKWDAWG